MTGPYRPSALVALVGHAAIIAALFLALALPLAAFG